MGKGHRPRPRTVSREEYDLRWAFFGGKIGLDEFNRRLQKIRDKERKEK